MEETINKLKKYGYKKYGENVRQWLRSNNIDSYKNEYERTFMFVLEGSPPRAYIIVMVGLSKAILLNPSGRKIKELCW